jgi:hypothetical protein
MNFHVLWEFQFVGNVRYNLLHCEWTGEFGCEFSDLGSAGECKVCGREVELILRLEDKWAAASVSVLFLTVLCEGEESLGFVQSRGDILQEIVSCGDVRRGWFEQATGCERVLPCV